MKIPKHLGVIPDGNRRWALKKKTTLVEAYITGTVVSIDLVQEAMKLGIKEITAYGFTKENTKRKTSEYNAYMKAILLLADEIKKYKDISLRIYGDTDSKMFPESLKCYVNKKHAKRKLKLNVLVNYSFKWDINGTLRTADIPELDLIIRWGGRCRLSGFLPYQSAYADIYVVAHLWPDANVRDLHEALEWYSIQDPTKGG